MARVTRLESLAGVRIPDTPLALAATAGVVSGQMSLWDDQGVPDQYATELPDHPPAA